MENKYTSLELSKKLAENGCKLESEYCWMQFTDKSYGVIYNDKELCNKGLAYDILNDICCKYAIEFFGEEVIEKYSLINGKNGEYLFEKFNNNKILSYEYHSTQILLLMQQGKKPEAEDYIWEHCKFNPDNKEK